MPRSLHPGLQTYGLSVLAALGIAVATPVGGTPPEEPPWIEAIEQLAPQTSNLHACYQAALPELSGHDHVSSVELTIQIQEGQARIRAGEAPLPASLRDCVVRAASSWDYAGLEDTRFVWPVQLAWLD